MPYGRRLSYWIEIEDEWTVKSSSRRARRSAGAPQYGTAIGGTVRTREWKERKTEGTEDTERKWTGRWWTSLSTRMTRTRDVPLSLSSLAPRLLSGERSAEPPTTTARFNVDSNPIEISQCSPRPSSVATTCRKPLGISRRKASPDHRAADSYFSLFFFSIRSSAVDDEPFPQPHAPALPCLSGSSSLYNTGTGWSHGSVHGSRIRSENVELRNRSGRSTFQSFFFNFSAVGRKTTVCCSSIRCAGGSLPSTFFSIFLFILLSSS